MADETSGDPEVDALVAGSRYLWNTSTFVGMPATVTFSFMEAAPSYSPVDNFQPFTETMRAGARLALAEFSEVAGLTFVEVTDAGDGGQIRFGTSLQQVTNGYASYPGTSAEAGDIWLNNARSHIYDASPGESGFQLLLHEIGHAVGLKHPGDYDRVDGSGDPPFLPSNLDSTVYTVMSYNQATSTPVYELGPLDIEALLYAYGPADGSGGPNIYLGTASSDQYSGTDAGNYVEGRDGDDLLMTGAGGDKALGGSGIDTLNGGAGDDILYGNIGNDIISGGDGADTIYGGQNGGVLSGGETGALAYRDGFETISGGLGGDLIYGNFGGDLLSGGAGDDTLYGGQEGDQIFGNADADVLRGNLGADTLSGGAGGDILVGGNGADVFVGGAGADTFQFWEAAFGQDQIVDFNPAEGDRLSIASNGQTLFTDEALGMVITNDGGSITLIGVSSSSVSGSWFV